MDGIGNILYRFRRIWSTRAGTGLDFVESVFDVSILRSSLVRAYDFIDVSDRWPEMVMMLLDGKPARSKMLMLVALSEWFV